MEPGTRIILATRMIHILGRCEYWLPAGMTGIVKFYEEASFVGILADDIDSVPPETVEYNRYEGIEDNYVEVSLSGDDDEADGVRVIVPPERLIDWKQIVEDLDSLTIRLRKDLLWTFDDLKDGNFLAVHEDHLNYNMLWLSEAKLRTDDPCDLGALEAAEDALIRYAKRREWRGINWAREVTS